MDIRSMLASAASELKWTAQVVPTPLGKGDTLFIVHHPQGVLAITRYNSPEATRNAFYLNRVGKDTEFHGYPAKGKVGDGSLTWLMESLVFTVVSKDGLATQWAEILNNAADTHGPDTIRDFDYMPKNPVEGDPIVLVILNNNLSNVTYLWYVDGKHILERDNQTNWELVGLKKGSHKIEMEIRDELGNGTKTIKRIQVD